VHKRLHEVYSGPTIEDFATIEAFKSVMRPSESHFDPTLGYNPVVQLYTMVYDAKEAECLQKI
jgi:hypothetical protein